MKNTRTWAVVTVLLAGCTTGGADTVQSADNPAPPVGSETVSGASPSSSETGDVAASAEPTPLESLGADVRDDRGFVPPDNPVTLPPGNYRSSTYHVPVTFTTTDELRLIGYGVSLSSDADFNTILTVGQPDQVVDLSPAISLQDFPDAAEPGIPEDRLMDMPEDVGAWLDDAEAVDIVNKGATTVDGQEAPWWDVELLRREDVDLACGPQPNAPPCQPLWPGGPATGNPALAGASAISRIWAVQSADRTVLVAARAPADRSAPAWFATTEDIVASLKFN